MVLAKTCKDDSNVEANLLRFVVQEAARSCGGKKIIDNVNSWKTMKQRNSAGQVRQVPKEVAEMIARHNNKSEAWDKPLRRAKF